MLTIEECKKELDKAADKCEEKILKENLNGTWSDDIHIAFKAGAEWMAGQGETFETKPIDMNGKPKITVFPKSIKPNDTVIVQILKK